MEAFELVFNKDQQTGDVTAAGYRIDNLMLQQGQPAAVMSQASSMTGGSSIIESLKLGELAVPLGLFYLQDLVKKSSDSFNTSVFELYDDVNDDSSHVELVEDSLYDKLLAMVNGKEEATESKKKNKNTRKKRALSGASKKTRGRKH
jgi:hypothetical protein